MEKNYTKTEKMLNETFNVENTQTLLETDEDKFATEVNVNNSDTYNLRIKAPEGFLIGKITRTKTGCLVEYINKEKYNLLNHKQ